MVAQFEKIINSVDFSSRMVLTPINLNADSNNYTPTYFSGNFQKGGIISKLRRRLTVQGDSETIDGAMIASLKEGKATEVAEDVRMILSRSGISMARVSLVAHPH